MTEAKIRVLDRIVADQIAAGEVVDRPASVVKELLENSIDAGATRILVEVDGGGSIRIRVLDNGFGLTSDDLELAFTRHATSKISSIDDLEKVVTFGFRGEALPSIASISQVTVQTRIADAVEGHRLVLKGGEVIERREVGCPQGTDFEVANLFFNTPARLKFLKKESTETGHCAEALVRLALVRPEVSFALISNGRKTRELVRVENPQERVAALFPDEVLAVAQGSQSGVDVMAILGPPERARAGAGSLYTYVNGRFIRDKTLLKAVTGAFAGTLDPGRYPVGFIALTLPPQALDVNVHPQKTEVRFADQNAVFRAVTRIVGEMVARSVWAMGAAPFNEKSETGPNKISESKEEAYGEIPAGRFVPPPSFPGLAGKARPSSEVIRSDRPVGGSVPTTPVQTQMTPVAHDPGAGRFSSMRYIGQARGMFLLLEDERDLVVIDQHAAHERVTYERLKRQLESGRISSQRLLTPHMVDLGPSQVERIAGHEERLSQLGLEVSRAGPDRIAIRSVPAQISGTSPDRLLADLVIALEEGRADSRGTTEELVLATMACHGSIRAGRIILDDEVTALLKEMDRIDFAGHCPHGRPVLTRLKWSDLEHRVGRDR